MEKSASGVLISLSVYLVITLAALYILIFAKRSRRLGAFRKRMTGNFRPALVLSLLLYFGYFVGTLDPEYLLKELPMAVMTFFIFLLGLTIAGSIGGFEPLPVAASYKRWRGRLSKTTLMLVFAAAAAAVSIFAGGIGMSFFLAVFHETNGTAQAISAIPAGNRFLAFFVLLSGSGLAEEGMFRLLALSFFWKLLKRPWAAIVLSSLIFGLYHLTPLDYMYKIYWQFPLAQVSSVFISGLIYGFVYCKRGFETSVLGHTLEDYIATLLSAH